MSQEIYERKIISEIRNYLFSDDILVLHGARQVGKTSILYYFKKELQQQNKKTHYIDLEDSRYLKILNEGVKKFLQYLQEEGFEISQKEHVSSEKEIFVFVDEIQYLDKPSEFLKLMADHHKNIKLIVSGSSSFEIKNKFKDSLVGRTINFEIFNLSFEEFLIFKNYPFERKIVFTSKKIQELKTLYSEYVLYGGYPKIVLEPEKNKKEKYLQQIINTYVKKDIRDLADIKEIDKFNKLLEFLASQSGNLLNITELSNTCKIAKQTIEKYLFIMENTYIIKLLRPYHTNIRSEIFKMPKIYFYDTGLMQMLWLKELQTTILGNVFETSVFTELVKKYQQENIYYWRTKNKQEIDFIVKIKNKLLPIEAKMHFQKFQQGEMNYFLEHYKLTHYLVVSLNGEKEHDTYRYPWEME